MNESTARAVLDRAEAWYDSWPSPPPREDLAEELDLYRAVSRLQQEACPYWPSSMWQDLQAQIDIESRLRAERGEHLIDISMFDEVEGERVERRYRYLENNAP